MSSGRTRRLEEERGARASGGGGGSGGSRRGSDRGERRGSDRGGSGRYRFDSFFSLLFTSFEKFFIQNSFSLNI